DYNAAYQNLLADATQAERKAAFGDDDIGQHSWLTRDELEQFIPWLDLSTDSHVLDIGSGGGGPAIFIAQQAGCEIVGLDLSRDGVASANQLALDKNLSGGVSFFQHDATKPFPFNENEFGAVVSFDAFFHIPRRTQLLSEIHRVLKPGGSLLYTDGGVVTGVINNDELALRSINGFSQYLAPGVNEQLLSECGFEVLRTQDATLNNQQVAHKRHNARAKLASELTKLEGEQSFKQRQEYLRLVAKLAGEKCLSRFVYLAMKPD
ncbi:MAG: methyltransferase domain-containing protein, partial [Gammaproteobacteria bacterium]|nr:methyltransferase domain-containing protein [Gammaproteobacteria bacterium]